MEIFEKLWNARYPEAPKSDEEPGFLPTAFQRLVQFLHL